MAAWKAGILGCAVLAMLGCKKDPEVPLQPTPDAGPPPVPTVVEPPDAGTPTVEFGPCAPDLSNGMLQQIMRRATTESANAKNELGYVCQVVREGETASVQVFLDAGGCYTFLGHAYPDVTEVDLTLKPDFGPNPPPLLAMAANATISQDGDLGPQAAIGRKDCFKNPLPIGAAARIEVRARTGSGPIAVKVFKK